MQEYVEGGESKERRREMTERYVRDGLVAVLISPGYGAGWSTGANDEHREFALYDPGLVELALAKATQEKVEEYIKGKLEPQSYFYTDGWEDIEVAWLKPGTWFRVHEYDGSESIEFKDETHWEIA